MTDITVAARVTDHDVSTGNRSEKAWPTEAPPTSLLMHFHYCELLHAWNLHPFKRTESVGTSSVDEYAEHQGVSRFVFLTKESRDDFLEFYALDDLVVSTNDPTDSTHPQVSSFWWLTLSNRFAPDDANAFFTVYRSAMTALSVVHDERTRAIRTDGNKVGFITADHFSAREMFELTRIKQARMLLGAGHLER